MAARAPRPIRCAIYTRKSTDEGLDRSFNSLDAQREACAAYVASQRQEGWTLLPELYDDGGFSGGSMDRPGLKQLLADLEADLVDIVVVYKVDRLTRSLTDFAKIVQIFDASGASFVSITQAFNTTTSMGRLTLNVLLSFAQFEREVITERIRDKVAASKARGMWMGGQLPLGYEAKDRKLIAVPDEAATVREIMERYVVSGSVRELLANLTRDGIYSKRRLGRDGQITGGIPFRRGALYWLLANRTYVGEVVHNGKIYRGEHEAIVSRELFDAVQLRLAERTNPRSPNCSQRVVNVLSGMVWDIEERPMSPTHTQRHGRRYRYYASSGQGDRDSPALRIPAKSLDAAIMDVVAKTLAKQKGEIELFENFDPQTKRGLSVQFAELQDRLNSGSPAEIRELFKSIQLRIRIEPSGSSLTLHCSMGLPDVQNGAANVREITFSAVLDRGSFGQEIRNRIDPAPAKCQAADTRLVALIARAFAARDRLLAIASEEVRAISPTHIRHLERIARLSYLDPHIIRSIEAGTNPKHLTARYLSRMASLPILWTDQRKALSF